MTSAFEHEDPERGAQRIENPGEQLRSLNNSHVGRPESVRYSRTGHKLHRVRLLTEDEEKKLRKIVQAKWPSHIPEFDLAINTGLRKGSQYGLAWDMVDWNSRMLNISRTKNDEAVHVPLNDSALAALKTIFERGSGRGSVFGLARRAKRSKMRFIGLMTQSLRPTSRTFIGMTCGIRLPAGCG